MSNITVEIPMTVVEFTDGSAAVNVNGQQVARIEPLTCSVTGATLGWRLSELLKTGALFANFEDALSATRQIVTMRVLRGAVEAAFPSSS